MFEVLSMNYPREQFHNDQIDNDLLIIKLKITRNSLH